MDEGGTPGVFYRAKKPDIRGIQKAVGWDHYSIFHGEGAVAQFAPDSDLPLCPAVQQSVPVASVPTIGLRASRRGTSRMP
jgi:hypothetical protein